MSEILEQENAIILAAAQKMVSLGSEASQRYIEGKESKDKDEQNQKILILLTAYRRSTSLTDAQLESILYDLRTLSEEDDLPSVSPIVGETIQYLIEENNGLGAGTMRIQADGSDLTLREKLNFNSPLAASDDGTKINVNLTGAWIIQGDWDGSTNLFPSTSVKKGYMYFNTTNSTTIYMPDGGIIPAGAIIVAKQDNPGQTSTNWYFLLSVV